MKIIPFIKPPKNTENNKVRLFSVNLIYLAVIIVLIRLKYLRRGYFINN